MKKDILSPNLYGTYMGGKYNFGKGGGTNMIFVENIYPCFFLKYGYLDFILINCSVFLSPPLPPAKYNSTNLAPTTNNEICDSGFKDDNGVQKESSPLIAKVEEIPPSKPRQSTRISRNVFSIFAPPPSGRRGKRRENGKKGEKREVWNLDINTKGSLSYKNLIKNKIAGRFDIHTMANFLIKLQKKIKLKSGPKKSTIFERF